MIKLNGIHNNQENKLDLKTQNTRCHLFPNYRAMGDVKAIKLVIVGNGAVGKTCLLFAYVKKEFVSKYIPTILDTTTTNVMVE